MIKKEPLEYALVSMVKWVDPNFKYINLLCLKPCMVLYPSENVPFMLIIPSEIVPCATCYFYLFLLVSSIHIMAL